MTTLQWYPGHMLETKNQLKASISKVDAVLEVVDARLPHASSNPFLQRVTQNKTRLKILNKADLADSDTTGKWLDFFRDQEGILAMAIKAIDPGQAGLALERCVAMIQRNQARKAKVMVVGIPNTGKSTLLNSLAGKKVAKTGNAPAITRHSQRTSLKNHIDLYDTPGILWPVIEPKERALALAASGAISDTAVDYHELAIWAGTLLLERYPDLLMARYNWFDRLPDDPSLLIQGIGQARGCLKKGGIINYQKASELFIRELRSGLIGPISFESPEDMLNTDETP